MKQPLIRDFQTAMDKFFQDKAMSMNAVPGEFRIGELYASETAFRISWKRPGEDRWRNFNVSIRAEVRTTEEPYT